MEKEGRRLKVRTCTHRAARGPQSREGELNIKWGNWPKQLANPLVSWVCVAASSESIRSSARAKWGNQARATPAQPTKAGAAAWHVRPGRLLGCRVERMSAVREAAASGEAETEARYLTNSTVTVRTAISWGHREARRLQAAALPCPSPSRLAHAPLRQPKDAPTQRGSSMASIETRRPSTRH